MSEISEISKIQIGNTTYDVADEKVRERVTALENNGGSGGGTPEFAEKAEAIINHTGIVLDSSASNEHGSSTKATFEASDGHYLILFIVSAFESGGDTTTHTVPVFLYKHKVNASAQSYITSKGDTIYAQYADGKWHFQSSLPIISGIVIEVKTRWE